MLEIDHVVRPRHNISLSFGRLCYVDFDRFTHLLRCVQDGTLRSDLPNRLGLSVAKVNAHIALARGFALLERSRRLKVTSLGRLITRYDPHFLDTGTLWFLHYVVASERRQFVWHHFASCLFPLGQPFTLRELRLQFASYYQEKRNSYARRCVYHETRVILRAYLDTPLAQLGYLVRNERSIYRAGQHAPLSPLILGACLIHFRDHYLPGRPTAPLLSELLTASASPVVILQLPEDHLRFLLEELSVIEGISLESRADLDQIRLSEQFTDILLMERYYDQSNREER